MSFRDNPIIDNNAHLSEESVNAVKMAFTSKRGFRCRDQNPDNGVDQNVELLDNRSQATGKLFGIQIKSTKSAKIVDLEGGPSLVWQFKTSRLGYLTRYAPPGYGLVVMYVEETEKCYFDFAEEITFRINRIHGNDTWQEQKTVSIHMPFSNELTPESVARIYSKLTQRFQNHDLLLEEHGKSFEIPIISTEPSKTKRFPLEDLEDIGIVYLIHSKEFGKICQLIAPYKHAEIGQFKKVCLFGTYAWMQIGHVFEAKSLLMRCKRFEPEFNDFEREIYVMTKYRLAWLSGDISITEFGEKMKIELAEFKNPINIINIKMSLVFLKVNSLKSFEIIEEKLDTDLKNFFQEIQELDIDETNKHTLTLQYCEIASAYINRLLGEFLMLIKISRDIGGPPIGEAQQLASRILDLGQIMYEKIISSEEYGETTGDKSIQSVALYRATIHFFEVQFILALIEERVPLTVEIREDYQKTYVGFVNAYDHYIEEEHYHEAYLALHRAADTILLFRLLYNEELIDGNGESLLIVAKELENEFGFKPYESQIEEGLCATTNLQEHSDETQLASVTDEQLLIIARQALISLQLPDDRLPNILSEMKTYRRFHQACQNSDVELLSNAQGVDQPTQMYTYPPTYKLRSRKTGIETPPSLDIEPLLKMFHHLMKV